MRKVIFSVILFAFCYFMIAEPEDQDSRNDVETLLLTYSTSYQGKLAALERVKEMRGSQISVKILESLAVPNLSNTTSDETNIRIEALRMLFEINNNAAKQVIKKAASTEESNFVLGYSIYFLGKVSNPDDSASVSIILRALKKGLFMTGDRVDENLLISCLLAIEDMASRGSFKDDSYIDLISFFAILGDSPNLSNVVVKKSMEVLRKVKNS